MHRTHTFTQNIDGKQIDVVLDKIEGFERDEFSDCTTLKLTSGTKIGVLEPIEEVRKILNDADRTGALPT